ncbi:MAG: DUF192 domain-containing protein [Egibacteraceae bacterium]
MAVLVCNGRVLGPLELATSIDARTRGLLGRDGIAGAMLLSPATMVHTIRMRFDIDVAFCDRDLVVLRTVTMRRHRLARPVRHTRAVLEAEAGAFARWGLTPGARLQVRDG